MDNPEDEDPEDEDPEELDLSDLVYQVTGLFKLRPSRLKFRLKFMVQHTKTNIRNYRFLYSILYESLISTAL